MKMTYITSNQQSLYVNDDVHYSLIHIDGLQPPKATIQLGSLPGVDGSLFLHSKVEQRYINMTLQVLGDASVNRRKLYQFFKGKQSGQLKIELNDQNVIINTICESVEILPMNWPLRAMVTLICPQPYFESLQFIQLEMASIEQQLQFPLILSELGQSLGSLSPSTAINAFNPGDIEIGFKVRFQCISTVENPKIVNLNTGKYIQLITSMSMGQIIEINTEVGQKRVELLESNERVNLFHTLKYGSVFFQLSENDNVLFATSDVGSPGLMTEVSFRPRFSGI